MKKIFILFLAIAVSVISCKKDEEGEIVKLRINHYQQPVNHSEFFYGLSLVVQEDDEIGSDNWKNFLNYISGFDYEPGNVYDIEVRKEEIDKPMIDAPSDKYSLVKIHSKRKVPQETTFDIFLSFNNIIKIESNKCFLVGGLEFEVGVWGDTLQEGIKNMKVLVGTFKRVDDKTLGLISLKNHPTTP